MRPPDRALIPIGYGTYGLPNEDVFTAVARLAAIGYGSVEICSVPGRQTEPSAFGPADRKRLVEAMQQHGLSLPVVLGPFTPTAAGAERTAAIQSFHDQMRLARDLSFGDAPAVYTAVLGGSIPAWDVGRERVLADVLEYGAIASAYGVVLALEPHAGGAFDTPEKARWLIDSAASSSIRLNFDVSHFVAQRLDIPEAIGICLPRASHIHVKDVIHRAGGYDFALPGAAGFDYADYFARLSSAGNSIPVVVEVSAQVWRSPGYQPWAAAEQSFACLDRARRSPATTTLAAATAAQRR